MKKKIISIILSVILIIAVAPAQGFALTSLDTAWQNAVAAIADAMISGKSSIQLRNYNIGTDEVQDLVQDVRDKYPEIFYADASDYSYYSHENKVNSLNLVYNDLNTAEAKAAYTAAFDEMMQQLNSKMTDLQKVLAIHNYLVKNIKYDTSVSDSSHDIYSALVKKKTVCDGYSKAFLAAMNKLEIPCVIVRSESMNHAWNQVQIDGQWYNIDVTYDDPTPDRGDEVDYEYFLLSDASIKAKGHKDWVGGQKADANNYESGYDWIKETALLPAAGEVFEDVFAEDYYYQAVMWAYETGITTGSSDTSFSPLDSCSRGQVVTFLWRAAGKPEPKTTTNPFTDVNSSEYYYKAVLWAYENGVTNGTGIDTFSPTLSCTNGQIITYLWRYKGEPQPKTIKTSDEGFYYEKAMAWGEENGLYKEMTAGFEPETTATRADIVTLMYYCR